jgi:multidrug transporter EmrE-like cation transporter
VGGVEGQDGRLCVEQVSRLAIYEQGSDVEPGAVSPQSGSRQSLVHGELDQRLQPRVPRPNTPVSSHHSALNNHVLPLDQSCCCPLLSLHHVLIPSISTLDPRSPPQTTMASLSPGATLGVSRVCTYSTLSHSSNPTLQLGVVVGLISTCVQSVGLTLQRKSHMLEDEKDKHLPRRAPYRRRRWQLGMLLFLLSNIIGSSIQITTLPLPLLSTLQASGLVFNALMATLLLHEPFTPRTALGTLLVAAGAVLISRFSALPEPSHSLDQLLKLLAFPNFVVWMTLTLFLVVAILLADYTTAFFLTPQQIQKPRFRLLRGMAYGLVSGVLSAHALLLAKSAVELLVRTIVDHKNQFDRYQSWVLLLLFLLFALTQLYYLHLGLKLVSTSILYPFVFCVYNIIAILDGLIYFRQADQLSALYAGLIALGTVILLAGVLALSWRLSEEDAAATPAGGEIPHSALAPGMGFVDDHEHEVSSRRASETAPLMRRHTLRDSALMVGQKRRRGSNDREVEDIWDELGDEERYYGTVPRRESLGSDSEVTPLLDNRRPAPPKMSRSITDPPNHAHFRSRSEPLRLDVAAYRHESMSKQLVDWWRTRWRGQQRDEESQVDGPDAT